MDTNEQIAERIEGLEGEIELLQIRQETAQEEIGSLQEAYKKKRKELQKLEKKVKKAVTILQDLTQLESDDLVKLAKAAMDEVGSEYEYRKEVEGKVAGTCACGGKHHPEKGKNIRLPFNADPDFPGGHTTESHILQICRKCGCMYFDHDALMRVGRSSS